MHRMYSPILKKQCMVYIIGLPLAFQTTCALWRRSREKKNALWHSGLRRTLGIERLLVRFRDTDMLASYVFFFFFQFLSIHFFNVTSVTEVHQQSCGGPAIKHFLLQCMFLMCSDLLIQSVHNVYGAAVPGFWYLYGGCRLDFVMMWGGVGSTGWKDAPFAHPWPVAVHRH